MLYHADKIDGIIRNHTCDGMMRPDARMLFIMSLLGKAYHYAVGRLQVYITEHYMGLARDDQEFSNTAITFPSKPPTLPGRRDIQESTLKWCADMVANVSESYAQAYFTSVVNKDVNNTPEYEASTTILSAPAPVLVAIPVVLLWKIRKGLVYHLGGR